MMDNLLSGAGPAVSALHVPMAPAVSGELHIPADLERVSVPTNAQGAGFTTQAPPQVLQGVHHFPVFPFLLVVVLVLVALAGTVLVRQARRGAPSAIPVRPPIANSALLARRRLGV